LMVFDSAGPETARASAAAATNTERFSVVFILGTFVFSCRNGLSWAGKCYDETRSLVNAKTG
jgi:hypothetical protein